MPPQTEQRAEHQHQDARLEIDHRTITQLHRQKGKDRRAQRRRARPAQLRTSSQRKTALIKDARQRHQPRHPFMFAQDREQTR